MVGIGEYSQLSASLERRRRKERRKKRQALPLEETGPPTSRITAQGRKGSVYILLDWIRNQTWAEFKGLLRGLCL